MNGVHDLGGMDGFGAVEMEADEPVFHHAWERAVFGLVVATSGGPLRNIHSFRHAIERMDPVHYLASSYYERWLTALATLLVEKGFVTRAQLEQKSGGAFPLSQAVRTIPLPSPSNAAAAGYGVGDAVRVRNMHPLGHTRCPRYVRGKRGVVVRVDGRHRLPDLAAHTDQPCKEFGYCVRFAGRELWGATAAAGDVVHVDLWESYLERS